MSSDEENVEAQVAEAEDAEDSRVLTVVDPRAIVSPEILFSFHSAVQKFNDDPSYV